MPKQTLTWMFVRSAPQSRMSFFQCGITCMTPRALAEETIPLLKPLSCHAIAAASEDGTPCCAASEPTCTALSRPAVAAGRFLYAVTFFLTAGTRPGSAGREGKR